MNNIDKKMLDATQLEYLAGAEKLQKELIDLGFLATRIEKLKDDRCTFDVIFFDGSHDYNIRRDYKGYIQLWRKDTKNYNNVSSHVRSEIYKKHELENMKVMTEKKVQARIDAEKKIHTELENLENEAIKKHKEFLETLTGLDVSYNNDKLSGFIVKNGIEFYFELCKDGYISKKISLHYSIDNNLETFKKLSDNKYL